MRSEKPCVPCWLVVDLILIVRILGSQTRQAFVSVGAARGEIERPSLLSKVITNLVVGNSSQPTSERVARTISPEFAAMLMGLTLYTAAFNAEIIRAGIQSVEKGQWEASRALGFSGFQLMQHVILPQALKKMLPPLAGQIISTIKDSAIVSVISIPELTFQGMELMSATFLTFEVWTVILVIYFAGCFCCSMAVARLEFVLNRSHLPGTNNEG